MRTKGEAMESEIKADVKTEIQTSKLTNRTTRLSLALNLLLLGIKLGVGILAKSTAMIADAVHSASDTAATLAVMVGIKVAQRPADENHAYGHGKAEAVAAKIVAMILSITGFGLAWESFHILREGRAGIPGLSALGVAVIAIVVKFFLYRYVNSRAKKLRSSALTADAANHRSDIMSTVAAALGIIGARLGYPFLDPLAGIIVGILILKMAYDIYMKSVLELMDTSPDVKVVEHITDVAAHTPGVVNVNNTKARIHGSGILVDMRLCVDGAITVQQGHSITQNVVENIHHAENDITEVLVHVNPCDPLEIGYANCDTCSMETPEDSMLL
jgi:cation diffusion facilitator family transporter